LEAGNISREIGHVKEVACKSDYAEDRCYKVQSVHNPSITDVNYIKVTESGPEDDHLTHHQW